MLKVRNKYVGEILKGGGISIKLDDQTSQVEMQFVIDRFDKKYISVVKDDTGSIENDLNKIKTDNDKHKTRNSK